MTVLSILKYKSLIFYFLFLCMGCGTTIQVVQDPFRDIIVVKMDMDHDAKVDNPNKSVYSYGGQYAKEIKNGVISQITLIIRLQGTETLAALGPEAYIKIDRKSTKLLLADSNYSANQVTVRTQVTGNTMGPGIGFGYGYGGVPMTSTRTSTLTSNILSGKLTFTKEMENDILSAKSIQYRLYSANDAIDLFVSDSQLEIIQKFIKNRGEVQK
ncbi:hypothetical protein V6Z05_14765 [Leptospira venezuelensis]|uniref:hypothetical protein n=1 Tax=Leptospira venezuelensis TaxID=1958811 RepID=UPI001F231CA9|nr:hypothetical protein [Leptospira venezuelensis]